MLSKNGESRFACLLTNLGGKTWSFTTEQSVSFRLFGDFSEILYHEQVLSFATCFFSIHGIM